MNRIGGESPNSDIHGYTHGSPQWIKRPRSLLILVIVWHSTSTSIHHGHIHEHSCRLKNQHRNQCQGVRGKSEWCNDLKDAILSTPVENPSFGANLAMCQKTWSIHGCSSDHSLKFSIASDPYPYYNMFPGPPPDPPGHRPQLGIPSALGDRLPPSPHHHRRQWPGWVCSCWNPCPTGWWNVARLWLETLPTKGRHKNGKFPPVGCRDDLI